MGALAGDAQGTPRRQVLVVGNPNEPFWGGLADLAGEADIAIADQQDELAARLPMAEVLFVWGNSPVLTTLWPRAKSLHWVHSAWAGVDRLLFPELVASDVLLTRTAGIYGSALAEYALAAMLYFAKGISRLVAGQRQRAWTRLAMAELRGATLGIVGLGDVGTTLAEKAKALGMRVVGLRRTGGAAPACVDLLLPADGLGELLAAADYLALCVPLTPQTHHLVGAPELARLKRGAVLVNISRGGVLDEDALLAALHSGQLGGAAVDVFAREPLPPDSPLWDAPNLLISPHSVDNVPGWEARAVAFFVANFRRYAAGLPLADIVDKRRGY